MQTYQKRQSVSQAAPSAVPAVQPSGPSMDALRAGTAQPTSDMLGHKVDLPSAMQAKMESAFSADLSAVQLYESQAVADAGAEAVTQGSRIAFAPGKLDFTSMQGQALLGHELSHVVSQARGEVSGGGFLSDHALEARADREGFLAAQGQSVAEGGFAPLPSVSAASAEGPMQAKKKKTDTSQINAARPAKRTPYGSASYLEDNVLYETGVGSQNQESMHRQAYLSMARTDANDATEEQKVAFRAYSDSSTNINNHLRFGKNSVPDNERKETLQQIKAMDAFFAKRSGLTEETNTYRGVNDDFMKFLFSKTGRDASEYTSTDADGNVKLDYSKVRSSGILDDINQNGLDYTDNAFVSTSTSRGFADYYPNQQAITKNRADITKAFHAAKKAELLKTNPRADTKAAFQDTLEEKQAIWDASMHGEMYKSGTHMMNYHLSDDVKAVAIDEMAEKDQNEFLLNRGMNYRVLSIREASPGRYEMDIEVMTPKGKKRVKKCRKQKIKINLSHCKF